MRLVVKEGMLSYKGNMNDVIAYSVVIKYVRCDTDLYFETLTGIEKCKHWAVIVQI